LGFGFLISSPGSMLLVAGGQQALKLCPDSALMICYVPCSILSRHDPRQGTTWELMRGGRKRCHRRYVRLRGSSKGDAYHLVDHVTPSPFYLPHRPAEGSCNAIMASSASTGTLHFRYTASSFGELIFFLPPNSFALHRIYTAV